ncbi:MAG: helix-turn-helix domain-containing protein [Rickettsia endosymbiont of Platyusa sonomae]|nr:helix-turn-helix domain-containing protein [Rickettsia endosymbiont of Platyusa sonomae]
MTFSKRIQHFLKYKLKQCNLKRKVFAKESSISYSSVNNLINGIKSHPELKSILKIANYFRCSLDEVIGRDKYTISSEKKLHFYHITMDAISCNLKTFIKTKLNEINTTPNQLSSNIGFSSDTIPLFLKEDDTKKNLSSAVTIALADYFQISLDEMVGRIKPTTSNDNKPSQQTNE